MNKIVIDTTDIHSIYVAKNRLYEAIERGDNLKLLIKGGSYGKLKRMGRQG